MKKIILCCFLQFIVLGLIAQTSITGKVTAKKTGEELIYANIEVSKKGVFVTGASSDFEGNYFIPIDPGTYEMKISYTGYPDRFIEEVVAKAGQNTSLDIALKTSPVYKDMILLWIVPMIYPDKTTSGQIINSEQIRNLPTKNVKDIITSTPGVSFQNF